MRSNYFLLKFKLFFMIFSLLIVWGLFSSVYADFSTDVMVNDDGTSYDQTLYNYGLHSVAIHGNDVYATWLDGRDEKTDGTGVHDDVYFAKGVIDSNGNVTFGNNIRVNDVDQSSYPSHTAMPNIAVTSDGTIFIVWTDQRNGEQDIYLSKSTDGGATFSANKKIDNLPSSEPYTHRRSPKIAAADGYVYVIFGKGLESSVEPYNLEISISSDNGQTFGAVTGISTFGADDTVLAADGKYVYIAETKDKNTNAKIMLSISSDHGQSFDSPFEVSDDTTGATKDTVSIAASGNNLYLAWRDMRDWTGSAGESIYGAVSHDNGASFASNIKLAPTAGSVLNRNSPCVSANGNNVAVSYVGKFGNNLSIIARVSEDAGVSWTDEKMVSDSLSRPSIGPASVAIGADAVAVIWQADGEFAGNPGTGENIYSAAYVFNNTPVCPSGISSFDIGTSILTIHSLCLDGVYVDQDIKISLDFNTMTFKLVP